MAQKFLETVYTLDSSSGTEAFYRDWAGSYDAEVLSAGYATPQRCALALAGQISDPAEPVLDLGCGTGLSGVALRSAGFTVLDGVDLSQDMLDKAASHGDVYRNLIKTNVADPFPFETQTHKHAAAIGLFSPAHAPASTIDDVMLYLPSKGCFVFSLNDHALSDASYEGRVMAWTDSGAADLMFKEYGPHLPAEKISAMVYVLRKR